MRGVEDFECVLAVRPETTFRDVSICVEWTGHLPSPMTEAYGALMALKCHTLCAFSSCLRAMVLSRNVNGASPQSKTFAQLMNEFSPESERS